MKKSDQKLVVIYFLIDIILLNLSILTTLVMKYGWVPIEERHKTIIVLYNIIWILVIFFLNNRVSYWRSKPGSRITIQLKSFIIFIGVVSAILIGLKELSASRTVLYASLVLFFINRLVFGYLVFMVIAHLRRRGKNIRHLLVLGAGRIGQYIDRYVNENIDLGYQITGFLDDFAAENHLKHKIIGEIKSLDHVLKTHKVDEIVIALPLNQEEKINYALERADYHGIRIRLVPDYCRILNRTYTNGSIGAMPVINIREVPLDGFVNAAIKRAFDVLFSFAVLVFLAPVYLAIGLLIYLEDKGPIFYMPIRVGKDGRRFRLYKFRTMSVNADDNSGRKSTIINDPRVTQIGRFLRKYSIDELPQFLNVLKGNMSIVGPRPHRAWLDANMQHDVRGYMMRHYLYPGITGWAQVNGWRGPTDTKTKKIERTRHDLWYMENWSLSLDLKIIIQTIFGKKVHRNAF